MESLNEDVEEYSWREVILPSLIPVVAEPELERETVERRRGRVIIVAVDHGPNSKHAFDWALAHLCRLADTLHLVHAVSSVSNEIVYEKSKELMEKLSVEAFQVCLLLGLWKDMLEKRYARRPIRSNQQQLSWELVGGASCRVYSREVLVNIASTIANPLPSLSYQAKMLVMNLYSKAVNGEPSTSDQFVGMQYLGLLLPVFLDKFVCRFGMCL